MSLDFSTRNQELMCQNPYSQSHETLFPGKQHHDYEETCKKLDCIICNRLCHLDNSGERNQADQGDLEEHGEDLEPLHLNQQVGGMWNNLERKDSESPQQDLTRSVMWPVI